MYYVYEWYNIKTNEIFYVGKGSKKRYLSKQHNNTFKNYLKQNECKSRIIKTFNNEQDAYSYEYERIEELKNINQAFCNQYKGGNGGGASIKKEMTRWTIEEREKYSKNNVMKREEQRKRMSKENPMKNKDIAKLVGEKHSKPFYIGNKFYKNLKEACKEYNVTESAVSYWLKVGHNEKELCYYKNKKPIKYDFNKNVHITRNIEVIYDNRKYNSVKDLAKYLNISYSTIIKYFKNKKPLNNKMIIAIDNQQPS